MAYTLVESYLYARPKVGYARNRSRTACFNEGFLKQAILGSKRLAGKRVEIGCTSLTSVQLPSLTEIGEDAFDASVEIVRVDEVNSQMHAGSQVA